MSEILQSLKSVLESDLTEGKIKITLSENELVNSSDCDVIRLTPVKCSNVKSYPGYRACIYEIQASVESLVRKREDAVTRVSEIVRNVINNIDKHTFSIEASGYIALKDVKCKVANFPDKDIPVKNKLKSKIIINVETFEEQEVS